MNYKKFDKKINLHPAPSFKKSIMALLQIRFCKKFLGSLFFKGAVDIDIHEELKNKLTTKFTAKDRICDSAIIIPFQLSNQKLSSSQALPYKA
jgi:hypothetical protein